MESPKWKLLHTKINKLKPPHACLHHLCNAYEKSFAIKHIQFMSSRTCETNA